MMGNEEIRLGKLTREEFRRRMESGELHGCILPVGATEQHLEHLAMEHDWRSVRYVSEEVANRLAPRVLVAEGIPTGISEHHMRHPGTLSLSPGTFLAVLDDLIRSLVCAGFRHVLVLNGHGGNIASCQAAWEQFQRLHRVNLQFLSYWDVLTESDASELLKGGHQLPQDLPGHAQEFETALALAAFPGNVRGDWIKAQSDPKPALATAGQGRIFWERIIERTTRFLSEMLEGKRIATEPEDYP
jgi:creatinine amidohydrolase